MNKLIFYFALLLPLTGLQTQAHADAAAAAKLKQEQEAAIEARRPKFVSQGGLTWMPIIFSSRKNWSNANAYCTSTTINGQTGWRLPTKDELKALYDSGAMKGQGWWLSINWSSTPFSSDRHYIVDFYGGGVGSGFGDENEQFVTCVR